MFGLKGHKGWVKPEGHRSLLKGLSAYVSTNHRYSNVSSVPKGLKIVITLTAHIICDLDR